MVQKEEREYLKQYAIGEGIDIGCGYYKIGEFGVDNCMASNADLICEMWDIPIKGNSQDYIIACHCLEHSVHTIRSLKEWHRLLKVGGTCAIAVPNGEETNNEDLGDSWKGHVQLFSLKTLCNFLEFVGFKIAISAYFDKKESADHVGPSIIIIAKK